MIGSSASAKPMASPFAVNHASRGSMSTVSSISSYRRFLWGIAFDQNGEFDVIKYMRGLRGLGCFSREEQGGGIHDVTGLGSRLPMQACGLSGAAKCNAPQSQDTIFRKISYVLLSVFRMRFA